MLTLFKGLAHKPVAMVGPKLAPAMLAALFVAGFAVPVTWAHPAVAQEVAAPCRLCAANPIAADKHPDKPLKLEVQTRLEFDKVVFAGLGEGQFMLSPQGAAHLSGAAAAAGARAMPGSVLIRGEPGRAVRIDLPARVELLGEGKGAIRIDSIVTDLPDFPRIGDDGTLSFRFGGDLRISGDSDGAYRGSVDIVVEYL
jgi:hypothetical protein